MHCFLCLHILFNAHCTLRYTALLWERHEKASLNGRHVADYDIILFLDITWLLVKRWWLLSIFLSIFYIFFPFEKQHCIVMRPLPILKFPLRTHDRSTLIPAWSWLLLLNTMTVVMMAVYFHHPPLLVLVRCNGCPKSHQGSSYISRGHEMTRA